VFTQTQRTADSQARFATRERRHPCRPHIRLTLRRGCHFKKSARRYGLLPRNTIFRSTCSLSLFGCGCGISWKPPFQKSLCARARTTLGGVSRDMARSYVFDLPPTFKPGPGPGSSSVSTGRRGFHHVTLERIASAGEGGSEFDKSKKRT